MSIKLGSRVRDTITGFEGILTSRTEYLYGCVRVGVEPTGLDKDGNIPETGHFDEQRIAFIKTIPMEKSEESNATTGGPRPVPPRFGQE